jgi:hypothetical protein
MCSARCHTPDMGHVHARSGAACVAVLSAATFLVGCGASHQAASPTATTSHARLTSQPVKADLQQRGRYTVTVLMTTSNSLRTMRHMRQLARRSNGSLAFLVADSLPGQMYPSFPNYRDANEFSAALFREQLEHVLSVQPAD